MPSKLFDGTFRGCLQLLFQAFNSGTADYFLGIFIVAILPANIQAI
jgi:hypothetical protein